MRILLIVIICNMLLVLICVARASVISDSKRYNRSKLIVIDGADGSGKQTQTNLLVDYLNKANKLYGERYKIIHISFPNYDDVSSTLVKKYLNGDYKLENSVQSSIMYTVDRLSTFINKNEDGKSLKDYYDEGNCIFICDRYTTSNMIHQSLELSGRELDDYIKCIEELEYDILKLPRPDKVIYLEVEPEVSIMNIEKRAMETGRVIDIHENINHMKKIYNRKNIIIQKLKFSKVVCSNTRKMRKKEDILKDIINEVNKIVNIEKF